MVLAADTLVVEDRVNADLALCPVHLTTVCGLLEACGLHEGERGRILKLVMVLGIVE